jgi:hypothetical protein
MHNIISANENENIYTMVRFVSIMRAVSTNKCGIGCVVSCLLVGFVLFVGQLRLQLKSIFSGPQRTILDPSGIDKADFNESPCIHHGCQTNNKSKPNHTNYQVPSFVK